MGAVAADEFTHSEYAQERRKEKARALGRFLYLNQYSPDEAFVLSDTDWRAAARNTGTNPPGEETRQKAVQWLRWLWHTEGPPQPPQQDDPPTPAVAVAAAAPKHRPVAKGMCHWTSCDQPGRLYPEGWRCDQHSPWARRGLPFQDDLKLAAKPAELPPSPP